MSSVTLAIGLVAPAYPEVIDDFNDGGRFSGAGANAQDMTSTCEVVDGRLKISRLGEDGGTGVYYPRGYELPEGQPVEFRVDYVSADTRNVEAYLGAGFTTPVLPEPDRGYLVYYSPRAILLVKYWGDTGCMFIEDDLAPHEAPATFSLTLTRRGDSIGLRCKVVRLDDSREVVYDREFTDHPRPDPTTRFTDSIAPLLGPVTVFAVGLYGDPGRSTRSEVVLDNLVCSADSTPPRLGIRAAAGGRATLEWQASAIPLEADSPLGPWRPSSERIRLRGFSGTLEVPLTSSQRLYRLASGWHFYDSFENQNGQWGFGPATGGQSVAPLLSVVPGTGWGRIHGAGDRNRDFIARSKMRPGVRCRDAVASVDLMRWGEGMEDASFGIVLRAQPEKVFWYGAAEGLPHNRYSGMLTFRKASSPGESVLAITGPGGEVLELRRFPAVQRDTQYRLQFAAVGDLLTLELFALDQLDSPVMRCQARDGRLEEGMDALCGTQAAGDTYDVHIDRYILSATTR
ncbi:MAG: hypothetical protein M5U12_08535 [Verrucomicrobia bacterium]|nr:hypothetical protein [Verrucomicrobiota bacterium]